MLVKGSNNGRPPLSIWIKQLVSDSTITLEDTEKVLHEFLRDGYKITICAKIEHSEKMWIVRLRKEDWLDTDPVWQIESNKLPIAIGKAMLKAGNLQT